MKPLIICDVDCTIYSYREFFHCNYLHPNDSMKALFSRGDRFPGVERTWKKFEPHIEERILQLSEMTRDHGDLLFLSAFPAENYKRLTFDKMNVSFESSFPIKKITHLETQSNSKKVLLTIGDRPNDKGISRSYQSKLVYLPVYHPIQKYLAKAYTQGLIQIIKKSLCL